MALSYLWEQQLEHPLPEVMLREGREEEKLSKHWARKGLCGSIDIVRWKWIFYGLSYYTFNVSL